MKRVNAIIGLALIVLLAFHGLGNALQLFGVGSIVPAVLGWALALLAAMHFSIGVVLTIETVRAQKAAGVAYWRLNKRFWAVRFSGFAIALLVVAHMIVFARIGAEGALRLNYFGPVQLVLSLLLVAAVLVHVVANLQPLMISLGIPHPRKRAIDIAVVVSLMLLAAAAGFIVYFIRWSVV